MARESIRGMAVGVMSAGRAFRQTHTHRGGLTASTCPPTLPRDGGYFWAHLPPADGSAGGVSSRGRGGGGDIG